MSASRTARLGDICTFQNGGTPSKNVGRYFDGDVAWITGADITGPVVDSARSFITPEAIANSSTNLVPAGTVLLVTRTSVGKVAVAGVDLCFSQDITALRPQQDQVHTSYLVQFLRANERALAQHARGATIKGVTRHVVADLAIPLPPRPEQRRIAAILDRAEAVRATRKAALAQLDELVQAIFLEMFGGPAVNPRGWPTKPISAIGEVITGNTPPRSEPRYYGGRMEWIKSDNINTPSDYLTPAAEHLSEAGAAVGRIAPAGSILVTCIAGTPECIGNAAIANRPVAFNQQINALVPADADSWFLYTQLLVGKKLVQAASTGGMKGLVSKSRFSSIELMTPPLPLQRDFARRAAAVERLKEAHRASLAELDALFASLQHRAFRGEL